MLERDFFAPGSVAVVGASCNPTKIGYSLMKNILDSGYRGRLYPVNPGEKEVMGLVCYPKLADIPDRVDMAVIALPQRAALAVVKECAQKGVKGVVMISAGFKEIGEAGADLEREMVSLARQHGIRILGPNCLGLIDTFTPINASFAKSVLPQDNIALVSQSGAMRQSYWDWSRESGAGLSKFVSLGNEADMTEADVIEFLEGDDKTGVILAYLEGIADGDRFRKVAGAASRVKPIIAIKVGSSSGGARATMSHTGSMAGANEIYEAIFKQTGVIRAVSPEQLFDFAFGLSRQPLLRGDRLAVVTNAGGPGVMASDAIERVGLRLASFGEETVARLRKELSSIASLQNPVDLTGIMTPESYEAVSRTVLADPGVDGVMAILCPQGPIDVAGVAGGVVRASKGCGKPVFANFMGGRDFAAELAGFRENGIPNYPSPERAVDGFKAMNQYRRWLTREAAAPEVFKGDRDAVKVVLASARERGTTILGGLEAARVIGAYGFRVAKSGLARDAEAAVRLAGEIGYPVVMKISSPDITHKTDVGGVMLGLATAEVVRHAYGEMMGAIQSRQPGARIEGVTIEAMARGREVILGMKRDPQFGAAIMFGLGGIYTEILRDVSFRVAPFARQDALDMTQEIRGYPLLAGARGEKPADVTAIADLLLRLAQLALDFPELRELDINPLLVAEPGQGAVAVDCRILID